MKQDLINCVGCQFHQEAVNLLMEADEATWQDDFEIKPDIGNEYNPDAVGFFYKGEIIGYVPDAVLEEFIDTYTQEDRLVVKVVDVNYIQYTSPKKDVVKWIEFVIE